MSKTVESKRVERRGVLKLARDITEAAVTAGRGFTGDEKGQVERYMAKAAVLRDEIAVLDPEGEARKSEEALTAAIMKFENLSQGGSMPGASMGSGARALKGRAWGDAFEKAIRGRRPGTKALLEPSGAVGVPGIIAGLTPLSEKVDTILQLIPWTPLSGTDAFSYLQETVRIQAADTVAAGDVKPTSIYTVERVDDRVRTIAHLSEPITKSWLDDIILLRQYLQMVLREGYELELEWQIISGAGVGEDFTGLLNTVGIQVVPFNADVLTTARNAITALEVVPITPGAYVFHPQDWETFELAAETTGGFLLTDGTRVLPIDRAKRQLWGYPVALSLGIAEGTGLLVDFLGSTEAWEREQVRVDWSEAFHVAAQYDDPATTGFQRNEVMFRCEGRAGFAVKRPAGVVSIDLEAGS